MRKSDVSATKVINDFNRRKIAPDWIHEVSQGYLRVWLFCNEFIAELYIGSDKGQSIPGTLQILGRQSYVNTLSPQAIADDLMIESKLSKVDLELINTLPTQAPQWLTTVGVEDKYGLPTGSVRRDIHRKKFNDDEIKKVGRDWTIKIDAADRLYKKPESKEDK